MEAAIIKYLATVSILDKAGYSEDEAAAALQLYDEAGPDVFNAFRS